MMKCTYASLNLYVTGKEKTFSQSLFLFLLHERIFGCLWNYRCPEWLVLCQSSVWGMGFHLFVHYWRKATWRIHKINISDEISPEMSGCSSGTSLMVTHWNQAKSDLFTPSVCLCCSWKLSWKMLVQKLLRSESCENTVKFTPNSWRVSWRY